MAGLWGPRREHENGPCQSKKCNYIEMSTEPLQYEMQLYFKPYTSIGMQ